jgi:hypothetical protein
VSPSAPEAAPDYSNRRAAERPSRGGLNTPAAVLSGLALGGAILAVVATFSTVIQIELPDADGPVFTQSGFDRYSVALIVLALFAVAMLLGSLRAARPAMFALAAAGVVILLIALINDLPDVHKTGAWSLADAYEDASASAGSGFLLETISGVLVLISGVGFLVLRPTTRSSV